VNLLRTTISEGVCIVDAESGSTNSTQICTRIVIDVYFPLLCFGSDRVRRLPLTFTFFCLLLSGRFSVRYNFVKEHSCRTGLLGLPRALTLALNFKPANLVFRCETPGGGLSGRGAVDGATISAVLWFPFASSVQSVFPESQPACISEPALIISSIFFILDRYFMN